MFMQDFTRLGALSTRIDRPLETPLARVTSGLISGTLLETRAGWQPVQSLRIGDAVQTLDGGLARIIGLDRRTLTVAAQTTLIQIDGGFGDACADLVLLPGQHLLLDTLNDGHMNGAPFAMIAAIALLSGPGSRRLALQADLEIITPMFAAEEVVYANSGVLLHCPGIADGAQTFPDNSFFPRLESVEARQFVQRRSALIAA